MDTVNIHVCSAYCFNNLSKLLAHVHPSALIWWDYSHRNITTCAVTTWHYQKCMPTFKYVISCTENILLYLLHSISHSLLLLSHPGRPQFLLSILFTWRHHAISQLIITTAMVTCRPAWNDNRYHSTNASMRASAVGAVLILKIQQSTIYAHSVIHMWWTGSLL